MVAAEAAEMVAAEAEEAARLDDAEAVAAAAAAIKAADLEEEAAETARLQQDLEEAERLLQLERGEAWIDANFLWFVSWYVLSVTFQVCVCLCLFLK